MDHDDFLEPDALFCYADALNKDKTIDVFYSDEDKTDEYAAHYFYPHFKSDFNIDLLHANNYMCHFLAVRKSLVDTVGGLNEKFDGAQDYDFVLRLTENTKKSITVRAFCIIGAAQISQPQQIRETRCMQFMQERQH